MEINNSTVYTKERLLKFNYYFARNQKFMWIVLSVATPIVYFVALMQIIFSELSLTIAMCCLALFLLDVLMPLMLFVFLPKSVIRKTKTLGTTIEYGFGEDEFSISVKNDILEEKSTMKYSMLQKAAKNKDELYLFIQPNNAFVVDLSEMSDEDKEALENALKANLKKVKWK